MHTGGVVGPTSATGIRPLLKLSYTLDWTSGWRVLPFHLTNLAIHCANALLVLNLSRYAESPAALARRRRADRPERRAAVRPASDPHRSRQLRQRPLGVADDDVLPAGFAPPVRRALESFLFRGGEPRKHQTSGAPPTTAPAPDPFPGGE